MSDDKPGSDMTQEEWEKQIPPFLREVFNALRQDSDNDPEGTGFALTPITVDDELLWGIVAVMEPPEGQTERLVIPVFTAIPKGKKVSWGGHEAEDATERVHEAFSDPNFQEVVDKLEADHEAKPKMNPYITIASADGEDFNTFVYGELLEDPMMYGLLMMDAINTIAQSYQDSAEADSSAPYMQLIMHGLLSELESPTTEINVEKKEDFH